MNSSIKAFFKLVNFEVNRLSKFLFVLIGLTALANIFGAFRMTQNYTEDIHNLMNTNNSSYEQAISIVGQRSLSDVFYSDYFVFPLLLCFAFFFLYLFFIWYREWFGKNTFIYRLMMLPVPRMAVFFSKISALFIGIWTMVSVQYLLLFISRGILEWRLPELAYVHRSLQDALFHANDWVWSFILGETISEFFISYGLGFVFILCLFTGILLERSFKITGIVLAAGYFIVAILSLFFIFYLPELFQNYYILFDTEILALVLSVLMIISISSILLSRYLINHKLTV